VDGSTISTRVTGKLPMKNNLSDTSLLFLVELIRSRLPCFIKDNNPAFLVLINMKPSNSHFRSMIRKSHSLVIPSLLQKDISRTISPCRFMKTQSGGTVHGEFIGIYFVVGIVARLGKMQVQAFLFLRMVYESSILLILVSHGNSTTAMVLGLMKKDWNMLALSLNRFLCHTEIHCLLPISTREVNNSLAH